MGPRVLGVLRNGQNQATGILETTHSQDADKTVADEMSDDLAESPRKATPDTAPHHARAKGRAGTSAKVVQGLTGFYGLLGLGVMPFNRYDGTVILQRSHDLAVTLEAVARDYAEVYRFLVLLTSGEKWAGFAMAYGGLAYGLGANHGLVPTGGVEFFGLPPVPERPTVEAGENFVPTDGGPAPIPSDWQATVPSTPFNESSSTVQTVPGTHINDELLAKIRLEATRRAQADYQLAQQRGTEGMPNANPARG
jgi:hypothetical protein